jgi:4-amino-4-deoxy-L-arabinose transferase-like glycosyltransferase
MPFSAMLTIAMVAAAVLVGLVPESVSVSSLAISVSTTPTASLSSFTSSTYFTSTLFGLFLGLAVLAKGPAAIILCGGAIFFWALFTKRWRDAAHLFHPVAILAFCVTALPWYILCAHRNPDFFRIFIIEHNFKRFLTPEFQHIQPFWYYAQIILVAFLPWTAALVWTIIAELSLVPRRLLTAPSYFLLAWAGFCVAFFTISRSKLPGYILPAIPPIALLLSCSATSLASTRHRSFGLASLAAAALFGSTFAVIRAHDWRSLKNLVAFAPLFGLVLVTLALANFLLGTFFLFSRRNAALATAVLSVVLAFGLLDVAFSNTPMSILSARYLAYQIQAEGVPMAALRQLGLKRANIYGINFYLRTDLQEWDRNRSREVYLLTEGELPCSRISKEMSCKDIWGWLTKTDNFELLRLTPNPNGQPVQ